MRFIFALQFLVSDDSTGGHGQWINGLRKFPNARLMLTSGLGIVRAYNKLAKLSSAKYIAFVQVELRCC